jgi:hypothetical protein
LPNARAALRQAQRERFVGFVLISIAVRGGDHAGCKANTFA